MPGIFITGTSTNVGKTLLASGIALHLKARGIDVGVMKPFATGEKRYSKKYASEDVAALAAAADCTDHETELNPYFYHVAASPYSAAKLSKLPLPDLGVALKAAKQLLRKHEFVVVEGIGGIMVPLSRRKTLAHFASKLGLPALIVTVPFLGTLNHTILTAMACKNFRIPVAGIIINRLPRNPDRVTKASPEDIQEFCGTSNILVIREFENASAAMAARALKRAGIAKLLSV